MAQQVIDEMSSLDDRRRLLFGLALAALVSGAVTMTLFEGEETPPGPLTSSRAVDGRGSLPRGQRVAEASITTGATGVAKRFVSVYLRYQVGTLDEVGRRVLARYSTRQFGGELLRVPVRIPTGSSPSRQRVLKVAELRVGLLDGEAVLIADVEVGDDAESYVLRATLVERGGRWLVIGIGP